MKTPANEAATLATVLDIMVSQMMLDGQDPDAVRATCVPMLTRQATVHVVLCNQQDAPLVIGMPQRNLIFRQTIVPTQPWPVVVIVNVTTKTQSSNQEDQDAPYQFVKRIAPSEPEQFNELLVALAEANVTYIVS